MKTTIQCIGKYMIVGLLSTITFNGFAQVETLGSPQKTITNVKKGDDYNKTAVKAPVKSSTDQTNRNSVVLPSDFPVLNFNGDPTTNFFEYIREKTNWFANNPSYLEEGIGRTRISGSYLKTLPAHVQSYVNDHKAEFEIIGQ